MKFLSLGALSLGLFSGVTDVPKTLSESTEMKPLIVPAPGIDFPLKSFSIREQFLFVQTTTMLPESAVYVAGVRKK